MVVKREAVVAALGDLYELTASLRTECPWDREQSQETIIAYTVEEVYELVDAIAHRKDWGEAPVCGELGDLLYQVFFLACVAEEQGSYDLGEVAAGISAKLVRRHPHIFGEVVADTPEAVHDTWEAIKRGTEGREGIFHDIPDSFPSVLLAQKLQQRAAAVGFDWQDSADVLPKVREELAEVEQEIEQGSAEALASELGDVLFAMVNLARKLKVDPEIALRGSALRFKQRVDMAADIARGEGMQFESLALDVQEVFYQRAKKEQGR